MERRTVFALVNFTVVAAVLVVIFLVPSLSAYAIYLFLGWFVVGLAMVGLSRGDAPVAGPAAPSPSAAGGAPLPSSGGRPASAPRSAPAEVPFCIYCAADLPAGADRCPTCGHAKARLS